MHNKIYAIPLEVMQGTGEEVSAEELEQVGNVSSCLLVLS